MPADVLKTEPEALSLRPERPSMATAKLMHGGRTMSGDTYELENIDSLPDHEFRLAPRPSLTDRQNLRVGDLARLFVFVNGIRSIAPWVEIVERTESGYVGEVGGFCNSATWLPYGTLVEFTADNIIEIPDA